MKKNLFFGLVSCLLLACVIVSFTSCTKKDGDSDGQASAESATGEGEATRTVVDHTGVEVVLPEKIERVLISGRAPLPSIYCLYMGSSEKLVGIPDSSQIAAKNSLLVEAYPELATLPTDFESSSAINVEKVLTLDPDIVFYEANNAQVRQALDNAGIPAVGFATNRSGFNTIETYADWIELLGQIFQGDPRVDVNRAEEIVQYGRGVEAMVKERIASVAEEDKPRVLMAYHYDDASGLKTNGATHFGNYWIEASGGINVARELEGSPIVNMEQVYQWNPEVVFITNFSPRQPEDFFDNTIPADDWSTVNAAQNKRVYKFPLGMYRWYPPSSDAPLALVWMAKTLHPDLFTDVDLDQMIRDYYSRFHNMELTDEDLYKIYNPTREASGK